MASLFLPLVGARLPWAAGMEKDNNSPALKVQAIRESTEGLQALSTSLAGLEEGAGQDGDFGDEPDELVADTEKIRRSVRQKKQPSHTISTNSLVKHARSHMEAGRYDEAEKDWDALIRINRPDDPRNARVYTQRANTRIALGKYALAEGDASDAIRLDLTKNYSAYFARAQARLYMGKLKEAKSDALEVLGLSGHGPYDRGVSRLLATIEEKIKETGPKTNRGTGGTGSGAGLEEGVVSSLADDALEVLAQVRAIRHADPTHSLIVIGNQTDGALVIEGIRPLLERYGAEVATSWSYSSDYHTDSALLFRKQLDDSVWTRMITDQPHVIFIDGTASKSDGPVAPDSFWLAENVVALLRWWSESPTAELDWRELPERYSLVDGEVFVIPKSGRFTVTRGDQHRLWRVSLGYHEGDIERLLKFLDQGQTDKKAIRPYQLVATEPNLYRRGQLRSEELLATGWPRLDLTRLSGIPHLVLCRIHGGYFERTDDSGVRDVPQGIGNRVLQEVTTRLAGFEEGVVPLAEFLKSRHFWRGESPAWSVLSLEPERRRYREEIYFHRGRVAGRPLPFPDEETLQRYRYRQRVEEEFLVLLREELSRYNMARFYGTLQEFLLSFSTRMEWLLGNLEGRLNHKVSHPDIERELVNARMLQDLDKMISTLERQEVKGAKEVGKEFERLIFDLFSELPPGIVYGPAGYDAERVMEGGKVPSGPDNTWYLPVWIRGEMIRDLERAKKDDIHNLGIPPHDLKLLQNYSRRLPVHAYFLKGESTEGLHPRNVRLTPWEVFESAWRFLEIRPDDTLVDFGAGEGDFLRFLQRQGIKPEKVLGIDNSPSMVSAMQESGFFAFHQDVRHSNTLDQMRQSLPDGGFSKGVMVDVNPHLTQEEFEAFLKWLDSSPLFRSGGRFFFSLLKAGRGDTWVWEGKADTSYVYFAEDPHHLRFDFSQLGEATPHFPVDSALEILKQNKRLNIESVAQDEFRLYLGLVKSVPGTPRAAQKSSGLEELDTSVAGHLREPSHTMRALKDFISLWAEKYHDLKQDIYFSQHGRCLTLHLAVYWKEPSKSLAQIGQLLLTVEEKSTDNLSVSVRIGEHDSPPQEISREDSLTQKTVWPAVKDLLNQPRVQTAISLWRQERSQAQESRPTKGWLPVGDLIRQASQLQREGRYEEALRQIDDALARHPSNVAALSVKANLLVHHGHAQEALLLTTEALRLNPRNVRTYVVHARVLRRLGRFETAAQFLEGALERFPGNEALTAQRQSLSGKLSRRESEDNAGRLPEEREDLAAKSAPLSPRDSAELRAYFLGPEDPSTGLEEGWRELARRDPELFEQELADLDALHNTLSLIASEAVTPPWVLAALSSPTGNQYAPGPRGNRYYPRGQGADKTEQLGEKRWLQAVAAIYPMVEEEYEVNLRPPSGSHANEKVYEALLRDGETMMSLSVEHGGHFTHGDSSHISSNRYRVVQFGVNLTTERIDYDDVEEKVLQEKPKMLIVGSSAYPFQIDWKRFREIADKGGALLVADVAHNFAQILVGDYPSPFGYADVVTLTNHKVQGPRGGLIYARKRDGVAEKIHAVYQMEFNLPQVKAKTAQGHYVLSEEFKRYARQLKPNAQALANTLMQAGAQLVGGGTESHLVLLKTRPFGLSGPQATDALESAGILVSPSAVPGDREGAIRIGVPVLIARGMKEREMAQVAQLIVKVLRSTDPATFGVAPEVKADVRDRVKEFVDRFPIEEETRQILHRIQEEISLEPKPATEGRRSAGLEEPKPVDIASVEQALADLEATGATIDRTNEAVQRAIERAQAQRPLSTFNLPMARPANPMTLVTLYTTLPPVWLRILRAEVRQWSLKEGANDVVFLIGAYRGKVRTSNAVAVRAVGTDPIPGMPNVTFENPEQIKWLTPEAAYAMAVNKALGDQEIPIVAVVPYRRPDGEQGVLIFV